MDCASLDDGVLYAAFAASPFAKLPTLTELRLIADAVAADDAFSFALACTPFCASVVHHLPGKASRRTQTHPSF